MTRAVNSAFGVGFLCHALLGKSALGLQVPPKENSGGAAPPPGGDPSKAKRMSVLVLLTVPSKDRAKSMETIGAAMKENLDKSTNEEKSTDGKGWQLFVQKSNFMDLTKKGDKNEEVESFHVIVKEEFTDFDKHANGPGLAAWTTGLKKVGDDIKKAFASKASADEGVSPANVVPHKGKTAYQTLQDFAAALAAKKNTKVKEHFDFRAKNGFHKDMFAFDDKGATGLYRVHAGDDWDMYSSGNGKTMTKKNEDEDTSSCAGSCGGGEK